MSTLLEEIQQLDIAERIQLVEDLWDSIAARTSNFPIRRTGSSLVMQHLREKCQFKTLPYPFVRADVPDQV